MGFYTQVKLSGKGSPVVSKKMYKAVTTFVFFCLLSVSNSVFSGAWVPNVGSGYGKVAVTTFNADEAFGSTASTNDFTGLNVSYYGEYGFAPKLAVYGTLLFQDLEQTTDGMPTVDSSGFGDAELGIRYQWQADPFVVSTSYLIKIPYLYNKNDELPRGNGQLDYEIRLLIGKSLYPYGYFGVEAGYRLRSEAPSDEYRILLEYGFSANENLYFRTKADSVISAGNADASGGSGNALTETEYDLSKMEVTAGWNYAKASKKGDRWGIELTYRQDLAGDNTLKGNGIEIGITNIF